MKSHEIRGECLVPPSPQRLGHERLPRKLDRLIHLTVRSERTPEIELSLGVIGRELQRTPILRFRSAPIEVDELKQIAPGIVRSRKVGREGERTVGRLTRLRIRLLRRRTFEEVSTEGEPGTR